MTTPPPPPPEPTPTPADASPPASFGQAARAVFWSFFGVRKGRDMRQDGATIRPHHVVIVGLLSGLAFVLALVALVTFIVRHA